MEKNILKKKKKDRFFSVTSISSEVFDLLKLEKYTSKGTELQGRKDYRFCYANRLN